MCPAPGWTFAVGCPRRKAGGCVSCVCRLVTITAWNALMDRAKVSEGQRVLVHAAAGGVGHVALQLAKAAGAEVHVTASSENKISLGKKLGAEVGINYRKETVEEYLAAHTDGEGYDIVFDTVGTTRLDDSFQAAKIGGTVVSIAARSTHDLSNVHIRGLTLHVVFMLLVHMHAHAELDAQDTLNKLHIFFTF